MATQIDSISVVIPTYNRGGLILRAINSVLSQTYPVSEIVVVDDASDFPVEMQLQEVYGPDYGLKIRVVRNPVNYGPAKSRNIGVQNSSSDFVAFLDSDDYWLPDKIRLQMGIFQTAAEVGLVYCDRMSVDLNGNSYASDRTLYDQDIWKHLINGWVSFPNPSSLLFRKSVFTALGGFDPDMQTCEDHDLWMRIGRSNINVRYVPEPLYVSMNDAINKLTFDYDKRLDGARLFLAKWEQEILSHGGKRHLSWFRNNYLVVVGVEIFIAKLLAGQLTAAGWIYLSRFVANPVFYRVLAARARKKLFFA